MVIHGEQVERVFLKEKKASESLEKGLRDNSKYTPGRLFRHSIYSEKG